MNHESRIALAVASITGSLVYSVVILASSSEVAGDVGVGYVAYVLTLFTASAVGARRR